MTTKPENKRITAAKEITMEYVKKIERALGKPIRCHVECNDEQVHVIRLFVNNDYP